jgi:large subunit ribosomal protein L1
VLDPAVVATGLRSTVVVKSGDKMTFHATFGTSNQSLDELTANAMEVYKRVMTRLERGPNNIRSLYIKTTMGPSVKVEVAA